MRKILFAQIKTRNTFKTQMNSNLESIQNTHENLFKQRTQNRPKHANFFTFPKKSKSHGKTQKTVFDCRGTQKFKRNKKKHNQRLFPKQIRPSRNKRRVSFPSQLTRETRSQKTGNFTNARANRRAPKKLARAARQFGNVSVLRSGESPFSSFTRFRKCS